VGIDSIEDFVALGGCALEAWLDEKGVLGKVPSAGMKSPDAQS
jgi:hypothetical protein